MKTIRALHLASFDGNIGDNANHNGFYRHLQEIPGFRFEIESLEIREFYWKQRFFDESFVELANRYDLLIIGGGNYFELWVEHSPTGTSIMIEPELFKKIKPPVFFNALGVDPGQGASPEACKRFRDFLSIVLDDPKNFLSVRNDGSMEALGEHIGAEFASHVTWTPDAGVCIEVDEDFSVIKPNRRYMAINLAGDMLETRFPGSIGYIDSEAFSSAFAEVCEQMLSEGVVDEILFIPHIYIDLLFINSILGHIPGSVIRRNISVAPMLHGEGSERKVFALYQNAVISLCMRFHANLCSIGLGTPTIGLCNYRQIEKLYKELKLEQYLIKTNKPDFSKKLTEKIRKIFKDYDAEKKFFEDNALQAKISYRSSFDRFANWLNTIYC